MRFTNEQRKTLKEYVYKSKGHSVLEPILHPIWWKLARCLPLYISANVISIFGLIVNIATTLIVMFYSPDCKQPVPGWALILSGVGVFLSQTFDALDGKQGIRTNNHDVIGEFCDHGCDTISTPFIAIRVCIALSLGTNPWLCLCVGIGTSLAFYLANLESYVTGFTHFHRFDVTEVQFLVTGLCFFAGIFGVEFFAAPSFGGIPLNLLLISLAGMGYANIGLKIMAVVFSGRKTVGNTSPKTTIVPMIFFCSQIVLLYRGTGLGVYNQNMTLFICVIGIIMAKLANKLMVAKMIESPLPLWDTVLLGPLAMIINQHLHLMDEFYLICLCLVYSAADLLRYLWTITEQACDIFDAPFFGSAILYQKSTNGTVAQEKSANGNVAQ